MAIKLYRRRGWYASDDHAVVRSGHGGVHVAQLWAALRCADLTPLYVCDTAEEAEGMRQLLERHREEVEALMRKRE